MAALNRLRPIYVTLSFGAVVLAFSIFIYGKDVMIPLAIAVMVWYLIDAITSGFGRIELKGRHLPRWACFMSAIATFLLAIALLVELISGNIAAVQQAAPTYQQNFERLFEHIAQYFGYERPPEVASILEAIDLRRAISSIAGTIAAFAGNFGLVVIYVIFLLIEQENFGKKMTALFPDAKQEQRARGLLQDIQREIRTYIWIKTVTSLMTGGISYAILKVVGVDYAEFWALVIFFLNYIPTIGSLLGIVFPALLTIVQFGTPGPFLTVLIGVGAVQVVIGNVVEPKMMGTSLNLSALVVILSLALWGSIWGVAGMFLSVPIMVIVLIICAHFPQTRPIAILLSNDGRIRSYVDEGEEMGR